MAEQANSRVHPAAMEIDRLIKDCEIRATRRSGPGGQHRNKVETAIVITHKPTGVTAEASERRRREENRKAALFRLRVNLALEFRLPHGPADTPSDLWRSRCRNRRITVNPKHADFPALLAEALDVIAALEYDLKGAVDHFDCSTSQLVKFLKIEPRALAMINAVLQRRRHHRIR